MSDYIIWSPQSDKPPKQVFTDKNSAVKAAYRMANTRHDQVFYVCLLDGVARMQKAVYENL